MTNHLMVYAPIRLKAIIFQATSMDSFLKAANLSTVPLKISGAYFTILKSVNSRIVPLKTPGSHTGNSAGRNSFSFIAISGT